MWSLLVRETLFRSQGHGWQYQYARHKILAPEIASLNSFVVSDDDNIDFDGPDRIFIVNATNHKALCCTLTGLSLPPLILHICIAPLFHSYSINSVLHFLPYHTRETLSSWLADTFFKTSDKEAAARVLYMQPNMSQTFEHIGTSMTNKIREGPNATKVYGTSYRDETYIHVTWAWLLSC
jgi:hypothetical protein